MEHPGSVAGQHLPWTKGKLVRGDGPRTRACMLGGQLLARAQVSALGRRPPLAWRWVTSLPLRRRADIAHVPPNARRQARLKAGAQRTLYAVACTPQLDPVPPDQHKTDRLMQIPRHARALRHPRLIDDPFLHVH
jgi:hypothetical protein